MKLPINYKKIIKKGFRGRWHLFAQRTDILPLPVWIKIEMSAYSREFKNLYGTNMPWVGIWQGNEAMFYIRTKEFIIFLTNVSKLLYSYPKAIIHLRKMSSLCKTAMKKAMVFYDKSLNQYKINQLLILYQDIIKYYSLSFIYGFVTWGFQVLQYDAKNIIIKYKNKLEEKGINPDTALGILIVSDQASLYNKKELALDVLAKKYQQKLKRIKNYNEKEIRKKLPALHKKINNFLKEYKWVSYDYNGPVITYNEVVKILVERKERAKEKINKNKIISWCKFSDEQKKIFKILSLISYTKDTRNNADDYVHYCLDNFFTEVGRRQGLSKKEIKFLWPEEIEEILEKRKKIDRAYLKEKMHFCAAITLSGQGYRRYYLGKEAKRLKERFSQYLKKDSIPEKYIKGMIASPGKVKGIVKVIYTFKDIDKVNVGDVLVTYMTSPRFMSGILKAGAIVTNDGGLTCHAAIIARELRKPCIIGTKIATKVLKDGDLVEVDANKGIVKKI